MMRWILTLFLMAGLALQTGCSGGSKTEETEEVAADTGDEEIVDEFADEADEGGGQAAELDDADAGAGSGETAGAPPADGGDEFGEEDTEFADFDDGSGGSGEGKKAEQAPADGLPEEVALDTPPPAPPEAQAPDASAPDATADADASAGQAETAPPTETPTETPVGGDMAATPPAEDSAFTEAPATPPAKAMVPVKKVAEFPFFAGGQNLNTVYVAREGDTLASVSKKIYGADRAKDLKKANPNLPNKLKVGDKVYYNSPNRPNDQEKMMTFYEDNGIPAQVYQTGPDESIRTISKKLLGHDRSWMEVWSTNPSVESKWILPEGTSLRYWPGDAMAVGGPEAVKPVGDAEPVGADEPEMATNLPPVSEPAPPPSAEPEPISPTDEAPGAEPGMGETLPSAPVVEEAPAAAPIEPEPAAPDIALPPPPPPPPRAEETAVAEKKPSLVESILGGGKGSSENLLLVAGVLTLGLAGALIVIRRRRKANRIEFSDTDVS